MCTEALFIVTKSWKQPACPAADERTKWQSQSMRQNIIQPSKWRGSDLYDTVGAWGQGLTEISRSWADRSRTSPLTAGTWSHCIMGTDSRFCKVETRLDVAGSDGCTTMTRVLNATEMCAWKGLKCYIMGCVCFASIEKKSSSLAW